MSSTLEATTSPSTISRRLDGFAGLLPVTATVLTNASRSTQSLPVVGPSTAELGFPPERPSKRIRLDDQSQIHDAALFTSCLERQVFPHIDRHISTLPKGVNTLEIRKKVISLLTGPDFVHEFKRGNGSISREFEAQLALRAAAEIQALSLFPDYQLGPRSEIPPVVTPVLPPTFPRPSRPEIQRIAQASLPTPRISTSPIPLPSLPHRSPPKAKPNTTNGVTQGPVCKPQVLGNAKPQPEVIIIDDDDDEEGSQVVEKTGGNKEQRTSTGGGNDKRDGDDGDPLDKPVVIDISDDQESAGICAEKPRVGYNAREPSRPGKPSNKVFPPSAYALLDQPTENQASAQAAPSTVKEAQAEDGTDFRKLAHALIWQARQAAEDRDVQLPNSRQFSECQPYLTAEQQRSIMASCQEPLKLDALSLDQPRLVHVDFSMREIQYLCSLVRQTLPLSKNQKYKNPAKDLRKVLKKNIGFKKVILDKIIREGALSRRTRNDLENFFQDLIGRRVRPHPVRFMLQTGDSDKQADVARTSRVHSLLFAREVAGQRGFGSMRRPQHFNSEFRKCWEDAVTLRAAWTGCAGDIATIAWVSNTGFVCGTTEHSDAHNQQYNRPGNLVLGSCTLGTLRAYPDHRIVRPIVEKGENSTNAMIQSQDPWLYSSVVSSDFDPVHSRTFTSGFDRLVKVWKVEESGASMTPLGEWKHGGNVNFVAASKHESGMVATAADVASEAVRIYDINDADISGSPFRSYSCSRVVDAEGNTVSTEKWAYFPATVQWGLSDSVKHLLLVGYSPRSRTGDDADIPEDRRDSGELCLWDGLTGERWRITSATTLNVFEVLWHPSQPCFVAATSPLRLGMDLAPSVRTQIRIFRPADSTQYGYKAFSPVKSLDCTAIDINELTIQPNSFSYCYVTAGCTDGCTYVWDTARGDKPIHVLRHGEPIDEYRGDREREDVGVKFTAWGTSPDRFYTGSSDGVVKVWNVRSSGKPLLVRDLLKTSAPITAGMFSPDKSRLVVGDASGSVFMLSLHEEDEKFSPHREVKLPGAKGMRVRRPTPILRHPEPPPPTHDAAGRPIVPETGVALARAYLEKLQLERHPNPTVGAVQGPRYAETGLFRREFHFEMDPAQPLLARHEREQQEAVKGLRGGRIWEPALPLRPVKKEAAGAAGLESLHASNVDRDLDLEGLGEEVRASLKAEGVDFELMVDYVLEEEQ
ncbi:hypothetical protein VTK26DRAFT_8848 [Humicola hyalothermophila]